jgi:cytoskeletal protein RodZ
MVRKKASRKKVQKKVFSKKVQKKGMNSKILPIGIVVVVILLLVVVFSYFNDEGISFSPEEDGDDVGEEGEIPGPPAVPEGDDGGTDPFENAPSEDDTTG